jgi:hypothetical protein
MTTPKIASEKGWIKPVERQGQRGYPGKNASLTTAMSGSDNDVVISARRAGVAGNSLRVLTTNLGGFSDPGRGYQGGQPARVTLNPGSGTDFLIVAREPGTQGNSITITLVDPPTNNATLSVSVSGKDITVNMATDGASAVTSTAALVVAAINSSVAASALVEAFITETSTGALAAVAKTNLASGTDDPNLTYVRLKTGAAGAISMTGKELAAALLNDLITAEVAAGNTGAGTVTALADTALSGGLEGNGHLARLDAQADILAQNQTSGDELRENNKTLQPVSGRQGNLKIISSVTAQDAAISGASKVNISKLHGPRSPYL